MNPDARAAVVQLLMWVLMDGRIGHIPDWGHQGHQYPGGRSSPYVYASREGFLFHSLVAGRYYLTEKGKAFVNAGGDDEDTN